MNKKLFFMIALTTTSFFYARIEEPILPEIPAVDNNPIELEGNTNELVTVINNILSQQHLIGPLYLTVIDSGNTANQFIDVLATHQNLAQRIKKLSLPDNSLETLTNSIGQLSQLQYLNLENNQLTTVPPTIGQLSQLQYLDLGHNQITALPDIFANLTQLRKLYLTRDELETLPDSILQLNQLQELDLRGTDIPQTEVARIRTSLPNTNIEY